MILVNENHNYSYDTENLAEIFFPYEKIKMMTNMPQNTESGIIVYTGISDGMITVCAYIEGVKTEDTVKIEEAQDEKTLCPSFFTVCSQKQQAIHTRGGFYTAFAPQGFIILLRISFHPIMLKKSSEINFLSATEKYLLFRQWRKVKTKLFLFPAETVFSLCFNTFLPYKVLLLLIRFTQY